MIELSPIQFDDVLPLFDKDMPNSVRIFSTFEGRTPGKAYVDSVHRPTACALMISYYNEIFLGGNVDQQWIDHVVAELGQDHEIVLIWPPQFEAKFQLPSTPLEVIDRFEFYDCPSKSEVLPIPAGYQLRHMDKDLLERCLWRDEMILAHGSAANFLQHGIGLCLTSAGEICSEAYATWYGDGKFEIEAITSEKYRGQGLAYTTCEHLIQLCETRGYSTYWSCHQDNLASVATARKLGYRIRKEYKFVVYPQ